MNNNDIEILEDFDFDLERDLEIKNPNEDSQNSIKVENENVEQSTYETIFGQENIVYESNNTIEEDIQEEKKELEVVSNLDSEKESEIISDLVDLEDTEKKEEIENPIVEMVNNKQTMRLIIIMLVVLFIAVFFMPKFFQIING